MIETIVALLMIVNNEIKEHRIQDTMSICLKGKRIAERQLKGGSSVQYQCIKSEAEIEEDSLGNKHIKKLILKSDILDYTILDRFKKLENDQLKERFFWSFL